MKKRTILLYLLLVAIFLVHQAEAQPVLEIPETEFDFGYVPQNAVISHGFWLKSVGTDTLKIVKVVPG